MEAMNPGFSGNRDNFNCSIYCLFFGKNIEYSKGPQCSFSCKFFRHDQLGTSQETPSVGIEDRSDYLRGGNVKLDDQSLGLPDQEKVQVYVFLKLLRLTMEVFAMTFTEYLNYRRKRIAWGWVI